MNSPSYRAIRKRLTFWRHFRGPQSRTRRALFSDRPIQVLSGPFQGLRYLDAVVWGPITPRWLGSYEIELAPVIDEIAARDYASIIDVGCAEGYYAVGLAVRCPAARVFAYDTDFIARRQVRRLARLNRVAHRLEAHRLCTAGEIARRAAGRTLVVCDIEGAERELLDPATCPRLSALDLLVEVHEGAGERATRSLLRSRFESTHHIDEIAARPRDAWADSAPADLRKFLAPDQLRAAACEHRTDGFLWLWMKAKTPPAASR